VRAQVQVHHVRKGLQTAAGAEGEFKMPSKKLFLITLLYALQEHTSTHTGEVLYTCPNCPMTFFCSANMYKHRQRLHRAQYEADKNQPKPPNILKISRNASSQNKPKQEI